MKNFLSKIFTVKSWLSNKHQFKPFKPDNIGRILSARRLKDGQIFSIGFYHASSGMFPSRFEVCEFDSDLIHIHMKFLPDNLSENIPIPPARKYEINQLLFNTAGELKINF
jgi:hypothetical protein